ncbi:MAG TPA: hypothetical protein VHD76_16045 [Bryobacteraceae bacterium]|nr:hypothetical protein [Bryobacteraceae bacterium]
MNKLYGLIPLFGALLFYTPLAGAQQAFDLNVGFGTAHAPANNSGLENASSSNAFGSCTVSSADPTCSKLPALNGFFLGFGGDLMLYKHFGVGANMTLQPGTSDYGPLSYRQTFYDFDGIFRPVSNKRFALQLEGGLGGARTSFSFSQSACVGTAVCTTQAQSVGNASHFQIHTGVGLQVFLNDHWFIKPEFDYHYVPNLTQQFGSNSVPAAMVWVGYSFGDRQ